jgi:parvulin-like peptidyl-prolyl isomerase
MLVSDHSVSRLPAAEGGSRLWRWCLIAGALAGIVAAAAGLVGRSRHRLPDDAAARVNGVIVRRADFERALRAAGVNQQGVGTEALRDRVLDHVIDEELLAQRGIELGLVRRDRRLRAGVIRAMIERAVSEYEPGPPSEAALQAFYEQHKDFFAPPDRMRLRQIFVGIAAGDDDDAALEQTREAARRLRAGDDFDCVRNQLGDREVAPIPDALLPQPKLLDYLGPAVVGAAARLETGTVSDPVRSSAGYHVVEVLERKTGQAPALAEIRDQVIVEHRRRAGEEGLRRYLRMLRQRVDVVVSEDLE